MPPKRAKKLFSDRFQFYEEKGSYVNLRGEMYWQLSELLDPSINVRGFAIPSEYSKLRQQLSVIRKEYDAEGRRILPPKRRLPGQKPTERKTLIELIGHSPDEADSLVIAVHALLSKPAQTRAGVPA